LAEPFDSPTRAPAPAPGERLFDFRSDRDCYACELRYHREYGVEARFLLNGDLYIARTFQDQPDLHMSAKQLAIAWADQQRMAMEKI